MNHPLEQFFKNLEPLLQEISLHGNELDQDSNVLEKFYSKLSALGGLHLLIPIDQGGLGGERSTWIEYNIKLAQYSGALLFLQAQHQSAISKLKKALPNPKIEALFSTLITRNIGIGVFSTANKPLLSVKKEKQGYILSGQLPWVTGHNFFSDILFSFNDRDKIIYGLLPFHAHQKNDGIISVSDKLLPVVFSSTNTVKLTLANWYFSEVDVLFTEISNAKIPTEQPAIYNLAGAAKALLNLASQGPHLQSPLAISTHHALEERWLEYQTKILTGNHCPLQLRATGLHLAEQCALFARVVCGANGLLESHPLPRICREVWQYAIGGNNIKDQREAYYQFLNQGPLLTEN